MDCLNLDTYIDFYFLQAMIAEPPNTLKPAGEKLWNDIQSINTHLVNKFAETILQYTFIASCGEARHGFHGPGKIIPELPIGGSRPTACMAALKYAPNEHNFSILSKLFGIAWGSGYGGKKWQNIADAGFMYTNGTLDKVSFIDHAANLEHNGGCYFNKSSAGDMCKFSLSFETGGFKPFLAHKAAATSLMTHEWKSLFGTLHFGTEVGELVHRYFVVVRKEQPPGWLQKTIITHYEKFQPISMGEGLFSDIVTYNVFKAERADAQQQAIQMAQMYAEQYTGEDYDTEAQKVSQSRKQDESAKEYWSGQTQPITSIPTGVVPAEKPVSYGKYTTIDLK